MVVASIAAMVLLIACANLANLLLARATAREREIVTRRAIGASRARMIRQLLTEFGVITVLGAIGATFLGHWLSSVLIAFFPDAEHAISNLEFRTDARMLMFMAAVSIVTCLLAGLAPAIRASGPPRAQAASSGGRTLIVVEVALCTILLIGSAWFVKTLYNLQTLDAGYVRDRILLAFVGAPPGANGSAATDRFEELRARLAAIPGVQSVGYSNFTLMAGNEITSGIEAENPAAGNDGSLSATEIRASPGFFATFGTPVVEGREFTDRDEKGAPKVAIVNEEFAKRMWGDVHAVGKHLGDNGPKSVHEYEIVGVVKDTKFASLREEPRPIFIERFGRRAGTNQPWWRFVRRSMRRR